MKDKILGELSQDKNTEAFKGSVSIEGRNVSFSIEPDDVTLEEALVFARKVIADISHFENRAKMCVSKGFLEMYNGDWKDEEDPELTIEEFSAKIKCNGINFVSNECMDFFYFDDGMFGGHSLIAESTDGENFDSCNMYG